jgi:hypothetical protein
MIRLFLILLIALFTMGQTLFPVAPSLSVPVLQGRAATNEYRKAHGEMYKDGKLVEDRHAELYSVLMEELELAGYEPSHKIVGEFFTSSNLMNMKQLGFEDKEEFKENATEKEGTDFFNMWR